MRKKIHNKKGSARTFTKLSKKTKSINSPRFQKRKGRNL